VPEGVAFVLAMLAVYTGPLTAAVLVTAAVDGRAGLRQLLARVGGWRVAPRWYLAALLAPLTLWLTLYSALLGDAPLAVLARGWQPLLTAFLSNVAVGLLLPALGEETGWRGFALPRLQARYGPLRTTLLLGTLHSLWHLPAFFTPMLGPFVPLRFATFVLTGVAGAFLFTWVVNGARGSALPAILLHAALNAAATLVGRLIPADAPLPGWSVSLDVNGWLNVLAFGAAALLLTALTGGRLAYRPDHVAPPGTAAVPV
jgi:membrane protease YdiL (CAAX protease family)